MTPEKVIELAKQAEIFKGSYNVFSADECNLQRFAELVRNETLEEAAKHCEKYATEVAASGDTSLYADIYARGGTHCAAEIRNLKS